MPSADGEFCVGTPPISSQETSIRYAADTGSRLRFWRLSLYRHADHQVAIAHSRRYSVANMHKLSKAGIEFLACGIMAEGHDKRLRNPRSHLIWLLDFREADVTDAYGVQRKFAVEYASFATAGLRHPPPKKKSYDGPFVRKIWPSGSPMWKANSYSLIVLRTSR